MKAVAQDVKEVKQKIHFQRIVILILSVTLFLISTYYFISV